MLISVYSEFVCSITPADGDLLQIVLLLLENSVKLNPQDIHMNTPLHFCCNNGHMESATLLMIVSSCYSYQSPYNSCGKILLMSVCYL